MTTPSTVPASSGWRRHATRAVIVAAIVAVIVATVAAVRAEDDSSNRSGCAIMSDSIGLYEGSNLTLLGVTIGRVTGVTPANGHVRVNFSMNSDVKLPANVSAVTTSDSIVTDRRLEIPTSYVGGATWDTANCIPLERTRTPKSLSEAFSAFDKLSAQLTDVGGRSPGQQEAVRTALASVDDSLKGTAEDFNRAVRGLGAALGDPQLRDTQLRSLISNGQQLADFFVQRWPDVQLAVDNLGKFAQALGQLTRELNPALVRLTSVVPKLASNLQRFDPILFTLLGLITPLVELLPTDQIVALLKSLPPVMSGLAAMAQDKQAGLAIKVAPPRVRVPAASAGATCAVLNRVLSGSCTPSPGAAGSVDTELVALILGSGGIR
ncbi:MlaD family protein [Williamsia sp.]|uniref:MlaD family protein n=1 Tax=Williamsia sp. TaxID=1872085 RepID=UPI001A224570|nr:MlaD family protein [Williamsia sp.]MBJ7288758.1 MCE family protein [Williamsia sp.]